MVSPENYEAHLPQTLEYMKEFIRRYTKSFNWTLDEEVYLVLASENNQVANGFATVTPNLMTLFYPSGQLALDEFAQYSWFLALASHETAHLFQLNNKGKSSNINNFIKPVVRNPPVLLLPLGVPMFVHPNQFLPRFVLEGNAVMNESRIGKGGRLQAGKVRAITYALIKDNRIDFKYLLNETLEFPFGNEKYWFGGYFFAHLTEKFGVERTNQFFYTHGGYWLNPLLLRTSFLKHFDQSYAQVLSDTLARFKPEAMKQLSSSEPVLMDGMFVGPMNHDQRRIYFLLNKELRARPRLVIFDKETGQLSEKPIDLAAGKVFDLDDHWVTATALPYKATKKSYGLYGEGLKAYHDYLNKIVLEKRNGHLLTIDPVQSLLRNKVSLDNQYWGESDSLPYIDEQGHVYDFIQSGNKRTLRRDQKPLVVLNTYDSSVVQVNGDKIYFIGNTPYGSSLFLFNGKEIQRLNTSDTIVDARIISDDRALVSEATSKGFDIKLVTLRAHKDVPVTYTYKWTEDALPTEPEKAHQASLNQTSKELSEVKRPYNGMTQDWRFSNLTVFAPGLAAGVGSIQAEFVDPLLYHSLLLGYAHGLDHSHNGAIIYRYARRLINTSLIAAYQEPVSYNSKNELQSHEHERTLGIGFDSTFWQWRRWQAFASVNFLYENKDLSEEKSTVSNLLIAYSRNFSRSYASDRLFTLFLKNKISSMLNTWTKDDSGSLAQVSTNVNLGSQIFWSQKASFAVAEQSSIELTSLPSLAGQDVEIQRLYDRSLASNKAVAYRMGLLKAFDTPWYTTRFPLGLRRTAPFVDVQGLWLDQARRIFEYQVGTQLETLVFQSFPMRLGFSIGGDSVVHDVVGQVQLGYQQSF